MNISLEETLKPYLEKILEAAEKGVNLAAQEIPAVIQEWLMYNGVYHSFWVLLSLAFFFIAWKVYKPLKDKSNKNYYYSDGDMRDSGLARTTLSITVSFVGSIVFISHIFTTIKIFFFPRVYLLQMAIDILGRGPIPFN